PLNSKVGPPPSARRKSLISTSSTFIRIFLRVTAAWRSGTPRSITTRSGNPLRARTVHAGQRNAELYCEAKGFIGGRDTRRWGVGPTRLCRAGPVRTAVALRRLDGHRQRFQVEIHGRWQPSNHPPRGVTKPFRILPAGCPWRRTPSPDCKSALRL